MSADTLIRAAMDAGVTLTLVDGKITAAGKRSPVVNDLLIQLRSHKQAVIHHLAAANDPKPKKPIVGTPTDDWRVLAQAYHQHHFNCPTCIAGGQGRGLRCGVGSALWTTYQETQT